MRSSGQWCCLHDVHQDDPRHAYVYPACERNLRDATWRESLACWFRRVKAR